MSTERMDPGAVWHQVTELIKVRVIQPTLWRAMEAALAITIDEGVLVIGFKPGGYHMSGHMSTAENKNAIERALREVSNGTLSLHLIDGSNTDDWLSTKAREAEKRQINDVAYAKQRVVNKHEQGWEQLYDTVQRRFAALPNRQFPQTKARYIVEMLHVIATETPKLMGEPDMEEVDQRHLGRVIDRVGMLAEVPPATIALELERMRGARKA